jgi:phosphonate transport system substrate-binding protein
MLALILLSALTLPGAAMAAKSGKIVIGIIPEVNLVKQMDRYVPLADYLEKKVGADVEMKPFSSYGHLFEEMRDGHIDAGFFGSLVYGITRARIGIIPVARVVHLNGNSTYSGVLFARRDAGIRKATDMKGKVIALVDPATSAGYLAQKEYFSDKGINLEKDLKIIWTGSHEAAIRAVLSNQAPIGGAKSTVVEKFRRENRTFDTVVEILNHNPKNGLPDITFAVRTGLPPEMSKKLGTALLTMHSTPDGRAVLAKLEATRFIATRDEDFKPLYDWVRHLKIDLKNYPYKKQLQ